MTLRRLAAAMVLALFAGVPLAEPFLDLLQRPERFEAWADAPRLLALATNTLLLIVGTLALSLPVGLVAAILLFRTDLPLRRPLLFVTVLALFIPMTLLTSAWQATLGTGGWLPGALWPDAEGRPWAEGLGPAIWIHALASLPWVILIVGVGLCWVEGELEEDALLAVGPWRVLWHVTLPRSRAALGAAALWVTLQTAAEITVTDLMQVRTFAEEVYTQLGMGGGPALARAVGVSLPFVGLTWLLIVATVPRLEKRLPPLQTLLTPPRPFPLGWSRMPAATIMVLSVGVLVGFPAVSLLWKAGLQGWPASWSLAYALDRIGTALRLHGVMVFGSLLLAGLVGLVAASAALRLAWLGTSGRWFAVAVLGLLAIAWSLPGPVVGIGFKAAISDLLDLCGSTSVRPIASASRVGPDRAVLAVCPGHALAGGAAPAGRAAGQRSCRWALARSGIPPCRSAAGSAGVVVDRPGSRRPRPRRAKCQQACRDARLANVFPGDFRSHALRRHQRCRGALPGAAWHGAVAGACGSGNISMARLAR